MDSSLKSTAGIRQFEQTAVAKLVAEGVPRHIASAFVQIGIPKSGRFEALRDRVCKMQYVRMFVERSAEDFRDPMRVGSMVPRVHESNMRKFHAEFSMSDIDAAKFVKFFPEFDVVARGKTYNAHGYYANKRYAECELLVALIVKHANLHGLDRTSIVDLGGNATWHAKRGRSYVLCNNPVLSVRDAARYKVRDIFSAAPGMQVNDKKFQDDPITKHYGMAVHSTYDMTPKQVAYGMYKRKIKQFYGVINVIPGIQSKPPGKYVEDGMEMTIYKHPRQPPMFKCGFVHDPSLQYSHRVSTLAAYLRVSRRYDFVEPSGKVHCYTYSVHSVRGNSLVYSISEGDSGYFKSDAIISGPSRRLYYLSLGFLEVDRLEVDAEMFDRLVLVAAGARNKENYNIVSLFKYAKSLRQRVSINGMVLSSGYTLEPEQLVNVTIGAFAIATAFRSESGVFFKKAVQQVNMQRGQGFLSDVYRLSVEALKSVLLAAPALLASASGMSLLNERISRAVKNSSSVSVVLHKPHAVRGLEFVKEMLVRSGSISASGHMAVGRAPASLPGATDTFVKCGSRVMKFTSRGLAHYDPYEQPRPTASPVLSKFELRRGGADFPDYREKLYQAALLRFAGTKYAFNPIIAPNGDRIYRRFLRSAVDDVQLGRTDSAFVGDPLNYFVFRGIGDHAVVLEKPRMYEKGTCTRFVLFFDTCHYQDAPGEITGTVESSETVVAVGHEYRYEKKGRASSVISDWDELEDLAPVIFKPRTEEEAATFVTNQLDTGGGFYMSGALPPSDEQAHPLPTPAPSVQGSDVDDGDAVSLVQLVGPLPEVRGAPSVPSRPSTPPTVPACTAADPSAVSDPSEVSSSGIVKGRLAMKEVVEWCEKSEEVALATARQLIDLALSIASGRAVARHWGAVVQGKQGDPLLVVVKDGEILDYFTKERLPHMAVSDGEKVYDRICDPPPDGVFVTSDVMKVYVGSAIKNSVAEVVDDAHDCPVYVVQGVAGCGKTRRIVQQAAPGDVVLCETTYALADTARELATKPGWVGRNYTVDSYLMHLPVKSARVLWIDEAFKLHAGKIYAAMKHLKPDKVVCLGDTKQIPPLPFVPDFDFVHSDVEYAHVEVLRESYRNPADIVMAMSQEEYYGFPVRTHNPIMRSVTGPIQFEQGLFKQKPDDVALLTFTKGAKKALVEEGVRNVMTIGESQGKTLDRVIMYIESDLRKALYYDKQYTLVGFTRVRLSLTCVLANASVRSDTLMAGVCYYLQAKADELLLASYLAPGVKPVRNDTEFLVRKEREKRVSTVTVGSGVTAEAWSDVGDWADRVAELEDEDSD